MLRDSLRPRIVSLAPALTEAIYALGLGDHVVAVSRFCDYPPEVKDLPKVGGLADVDVEAVIRRVPDMVVLPPAQAHLRETLLRLKDPPEVLVVRTDRLEDVYNAMWKIGEARDRTKEAEAWLGEMEKIMTPDQCTNRRRCFSASAARARNWNGCGLPAPARSTTTSSRRSAA
jgi:iron complex transport system substrate-binding protein